MQLELLHRILEIVTKAAQRYTEKLVPCGCPGYLRAVKCVKFYSPLLGLLTSKYVAFLVLSHPFHCESLGKLPWRLGLEPGPLVYS